jgi:hypothetical protein
MAARARWKVCIAMMTLLLGVAPAPAAVAAQAPATAPRKTQTIQAEVRTEQWSGWGGWQELPAGVKQEQAPEKFTRFPAPQGQPQTFSGKVTNFPPGKAAQVGVVAVVGTHWIKPDNYKWQKCEPDGSFTITGDHKPGAKKALVAAVGDRPWTFLRAEFAPRESARDVEIRVKEGKTLVLTMEDSQGKAVRGFQGEVFNAYVTTDDQGKQLKAQRLGALTSSGGAIVFAAPLEPIGVLLAASGIAPYYAVIDPREADEFHFKMLAESRVRGVVTRDGQPVAGQQIYMVNGAAPLSATLRKTDAQGRFDIAGRVPGRHDIRVGAYRTTVQVQPGETAELNIEVSAAAASSPPAAAAR